MSGNTESKIENRFQADYEIVKQYLQSVGLNVVKYNPQSEFILTLTYDDLIKLDRQVCDAYAFELMRFSAVLQKEENFLKGKLIWAEHNMEIVIGKYGKMYGDKFTPYEERKNMVRVDNEFAIELNKMIVDVKLKLTNLYGISNKIVSLSKILESLSYGKKTSV